MRINFVAPDPGSFISGGNIYNAGLAKGFAANGAQVRFTESPDNNTPGSFNIIDSIYFDRLGSNLPHNSIGLIHHLNSLYPLSPDRFEQNDRPLLDMMGGFLVSSQWMCDFLVRKGYRRSKIHVAEPVPPELRKKEYQPVTKVKALMLNNLVERKGVLHFLKRLAEARISPTYELRIVGSMTADTEYANMCTSLVRDDKNLRSTVKFLGAQDNQSVEALMQKSNLFVSASHMETFGMSIQEAAIRRIPLLVFDGGNAGNHVEQGINGWKSNSVGEMVKTFEDLVNTPSKLDAMTKRSLEFEPTYPFSWENSASNIIEFMQSDI